MLNGDRDERVNHIISNSSKLVLNKYKIMHGLLETLSSKSCERD